MLKVNIKKKLNFWEIIQIAKSKNLNYESLLRQAQYQNVLIEEDQKILIKFINHFKSLKNFNSQIFQDIFASFVIDKFFEKTFLEFGATDGLSLSNSLMLEKDLNWKGVLAEPSPQWHESLKLNRKDTPIIDKCIWSKSNERLEFFMSSYGELSTIVDFVDNDIEKLPLNTSMRKKNGKKIFVETISLNDVVKIFFNGKCPSYISVDTEGSEYDILKSFNFDNYKPHVFTIEHNHTKYEKKIDKLMISNNYVRIFRNLTDFDAWYVSSDAFKKIS